MKRLNWLSGAAVSLAAMGILIPNAPTIASDTGGTARANVRTVNAKIFDIALSNGGTFKGRIVDHTGTPLEGAEVVIRQDKREVARLTSDKSGSFSIGNMKSGIYLVSSGNTEGAYRFWSEQTAPPTAKEQGLLVMGENGARGNFGYVDGNGIYVVAALSIAALTVGIIALVRANNDNDNGVPPVNGSKTPASP